MTQDVENALNRMLCWNPGIDEIALVPWPDETMISAKYLSACLANHAHVQEMDFEQRKTLIFIEAMHMIIRDKCDPMAVHKTLCGLEEYRDGLRAGMLDTTED
ncbi:MAG: hypothetical protein CL942_08390 [Desulfovibrio sp.]|nr:hypothetical protein [Desulfovibrio sp.]|tara:strand:+ start:11033 stop:11341 length:309 start_codon:yes stop_codon:yes gene_type:complete